MNVEMILQMCEYLRQLLEAVAGGMSKQVMESEPSQINLSSKGE